MIVRPILEVHHVSFRSWPAERALACMHARLGKEDSDAIRVHETRMQPPRLLHIIIPRLWIKFMTEPPILGGFQRSVKIATAFLDGICTYIIRSRSIRTIWTSLNRPTWLGGCCRRRRLLGETPCTPSWASTHPTSIRSRSVTLQATGGKHVRKQTTAVRRSENHAFRFQCLINRNNALSHMLLAMTIAS